MNGRSSGCARPIDSYLITPNSYLSIKVVSVMPKKIPMRQCLGCREMKPKNQLIRVVRSPEGEISLDFRGKKPGRGAYLCPDPACLARVKKSRALERAFSCQVDPAVYEALEGQMKAGDGG